MVFQKSCANMSVKDQGWFFEAIKVSKDLEWARLFNGKGTGGVIFQAWSQATAKTPWQVWGGQLPCPSPQGEEREGSKTLPTLTRYPAPFCFHPFPSLPSHTHAGSGTYQSLAFGAFTNELTPRLHWPT